MLNSLSWPFILKRQYQILFVISLLVHMNSLPSVMISDDREAVLANPDVTMQQPLKSIFLNDFWGSPMSSPESHKSYRPLTTLTYRIQFDLHGVWPIGFHLANILLHIIFTLIYCEFSTVISNSQKIGFISALLFTVHSIHTEAVTCIVGRAEILSAIFYTLAFFLYKYSCNEKENHSTLLRIIYFFMSCLSTVASMLCKEQGITIVGFLIFYDLSINYFTPFYKSSRSKSINYFLIRCVSLLIFSLTVIYLRVFYISGSARPLFKDSDNPAAFSNSSITRLLTYSYLGSLNWWLLLCPYWLCSDWSMGSIALVTSVNDYRLLWTAFVYIIFICLGIFSLIQLVKRFTRLYVCAILLILLPYLPASNLFFTVGFVIAERILYLPSMGFCLLVSVGFIKLIQSVNNRGIKGLLYGSMCILIILQSCKIILRNFDWYSEESIVISDLKVNPENAKLHLALGNVLTQQRRRDCEKHYKKAIELRPSYEAAWSNLGFVLLNMGRHEEAEECYKSGIRIKWDHIDTNINYGHLLKLQERWKEAAEKFQIVLNRRPYYEHIRYHMGAIQEKLGNISGAEKEYRIALTINPNSYDSNLALFNIIYKYDATGFATNYKFMPKSRIKESIRILRIILSINPSDKINFYPKLIDMLNFLEEKGEASLIQNEYNLLKKNS